MAAQTFALEKYKVDRTWFGTARLEQGGQWQMLYRPFRAVVLPGGLAAVVVAWATATKNPALLTLLFILVPWIGYAILHYSVGATRIMANHKRAGDIRLMSQARSGRVMGIYSLGYFLTYVAIIAPLFAVGFTFGYFFFDEFGDLPNLARLHGMERVALIAGTVVLYFSVFLSWSVLRHTFVTMPVWQHYSETLTILGARGLAEVRQRDRDELAEAEGFAEALDLGAAI